MRETNHGDNDDEDDAIRKYIDRHEENHRGSTASGSVVKLRSALKSIPEPHDDEVEIIEPVKGHQDVENCKVYTQKELDQAKKLLDRAFVDFYRSLTFLSSFRYLTLADGTLKLVIKHRCPGYILVCAGYDSATGDLTIDVVLR